MRALLAEHTAKLIRYTQNGPMYQTSDEATLSLIGSLDALLEIEMVSHCGYEVLLDHTHKRAKHAKHHDPAIPFELNDEHVLQVFLYGLKPDRRELAVDVWLADGTCQSLKADFRAGTGLTFNSRLSGIVDWSMVVTNKEPLDLVIQSKRGGAESEERVLLLPGEHHVEVAPRFCERYAFCLSPANDPFGSIEFKHSFMGEVGAASGRFLWSRDKLWLPPVANPPSYVSLVIDCVNQGLSDSGAEEIRRADEVEVMTSKDRREEVEGVLQRFPAVRSKVTTVSLGFDDTSADIAIVSPQTTVPENWPGKISCLLFHDQAEANFAELLVSTLGRLKHDTSAASKAIESIWITSQANYLDEERSASYGVAWTTSSQHSRRSRVELFKALNLGDKDKASDIRRYAAQPYVPGAFSLI